MRLTDLAGRRIGVLGLGRDTRALLPLLVATAPAQLVVVEEGDPAPARAALAELDLGSVSVVAAPASLPAVDVLVRSPGFPLYRDDVQAVLSAGAVSVAPLGLWLAERNAAGTAGATVGVTGTKGKSSTCVLIKEGLGVAGMPSIVAGNIGVPIWEVPPGHPEVVVVEVSSFQAADLADRPDVAVLTSLSPEHLDWHGTVERYFADKKRLFTNGMGVAPEGNATVAQWGRDLDLQWVRPARADGVDAHRVNNVALAAATVSRLTGDADTEALAAKLLADYPDLPGRLNLVAAVDGVDYVDDALGTNPLATAAALRSVGDRPIVHICGGADRGIPLGPLSDALAERPARSVRVMVMGDIGPRIARAVADISSVMEVVRVESVTAAVERARSGVEPGGVVLFSPCAPTPPDEGSWKDRSEAFGTAVRNLTHTDGGAAGGSYTP